MTFSLQKFLFEKLPAAVTLHFLVHGVVVITVAYSTALFLLNYPVSWLPYWFILQAGFDSLVLFGTAPLLNKNIANVALYAYLAVAAAILLVFFSMSLHWYLTPFVFVLLLNSFSLILFTLAWGQANSAFDLIEIKRVSSWLVGIGTVGEIVFSILVIGFVKFFGMHALAYFLVATVILSSITLYPLQPLPATVKKMKHGGEPLKYQLYQKIFVSTFILSVVYVLVDYSLKFKLGQLYSGRQISEFVSALMGISNVITLLLSLFFIKWIISRFGVARLMALMPLYWLVTAIIVIFIPSVWAIAVVAAGRYILFSATFVVGRELTVNALPREVRSLGQFRLRAVVTPIAVGTTALVLFILKNHINLSLIASIIALLSLFLFFYITSIDKSYVATLQGEVELKRFNVGLDLNEHNINVIKDIVLSALASTDLNFVRFGFSLLSKIQLTVLPEQVPALLQLEDVDIRLSAIKCMVDCKAREQVGQLLQRLNVECDSEVRWKLFDAIAALDAERGGTIARQFITDVAPENRGGAMRILFAAGNLDDELRAVNALKAMIYDANVEMRKYAARVLGYLHIGHLQKELTMLIDDIDDTVSAKAIDAVTRQNMVDELAPTIIARLGKGRVFYSAQHALHKIGIQSAHLIMQNIANSKDNPNLNFAVLVKMLAAINDTAVEKYFIQLAQDLNPVISDVVAKEMAYRACYAQVSREFKNQAVEFALREAQLISLLHFMQKQQTKTFVIAEIASRIFLAKRRYLYWLAVNANAQEVISFMPIILTGIQFEKAKAIELLNSLIGNRRLAEISVDIFLQAPQPPSAEVLSKQSELIDGWLQKVIEYKPHLIQGNVMQNMQKVFVLRAVELFKTLPSETLLIIAEETEVVGMQAGQTIFSVGDPPTGLFIIVSGEVEIIKNNQVINHLKENEFFGELALIDNAGRSASVVAKTEGTLLYLDKETFDRITDDLPEVLRGVVRIILSYLRGYLAK